MGLGGVIFRVSEACMAALFLAGAYVQLNDPDPELWVLTYAVAALTCMAAALGTRESVIGLATAYSLGTVIATSATVLRPAALGVLKHGATFAALARVEECRELLGLAILALWLSYTFVVAADGGGGGYLSSYYYFYTARDSVVSGSGADPKPVLRSPPPAHMKDIGGKASAAAGGQSTTATLGAAFALSAPVVLAVAWYAWLNMLSSGQLREYDLPEHCTGTF